LPRAASAAESENTALQAPRNLNAPTFGSAPTGHDGRAIGIRADPLGGLLDAIQGWWHDRSDGSGDSVSGPLLLHVLLE
jgi:hypothetical protein